MRDGELLYEWVVARVCCRWNAVFARGYNYVRAGLRWKDYLTQDLAQTKRIHLFYFQWSAMAVKCCKSEGVKDLTRTLTF